MTVFNGSDINVEKYQLFPVMDPRSLVCLSGVNKNAHIALPNGQFFQVLLLQLHPLQGKMQEFFLHLRTYYPECWAKFACAMPLCNSPFLKREFVQQATPAMMKDLTVKKEGIEAKKLEIEKQLSALCGDFDEDPNSPFYKAEQASKQDELIFEGMFSRCCNFDRLDHEQLLNALYKEVKPIIELIEDKIGEEFIASLHGPGTQTKADAFTIAKLIFVTMLLQEDLVMLLSAIKEGREVQNVLVFGNPYLSNIKKSLTKCDWKLSDLFDFNCIDNYLNVAYLLKEELKGGICLPFLNMNHSKSCFENLENKKYAYVSQLTNYSLEINYIDQQLKDCEQFNRLSLLTELCFTKNLEDIAYDTDHCSFILQIQRMPDVSADQYTTDDQFFAMQVLNGKYVRADNKPNFIREILYHDLPNGAPELEWLQDHWKEFLPKLKCISMKLHSLLASYTEMIHQDTNFNLSIKTCLDRHFDSIKEKLPALKNMQKMLKECDAAEPKITHLDIFEMVRYEFDLCPHIPQILTSKKYDGLYPEVRSLIVLELLPKVTALIDEIERRLAQMPTIENAQ